MPVIIHPPETPFPPGHPFATPRIFFGVKPPPNWPRKSDQQEEIQDSDKSDNSPETNNDISGNV